MTDIEKRIAKYKEMIVEKERVIKYYERDLTDARKRPLNCFGTNHKETRYFEIFPYWSNDPDAWIEVLQNNIKEIVTFIINNKTTVYSVEIDSDQELGINLMHENVESYQAEKKQELINMCTNKIKELNDEIEDIKFLIKRLQEANIE
jgi:hypothetical protein